MRRTNLLFLLLCFSIPLYANIIFPSMLLIGGIWDIFSWLIIVIAFIIELIVIRLCLPKESFAKIFMATIIMNFVSEIFGVLGLFIFDILSSLAASLLPFLEILLPPMGYLILLVIVSIFINTAIELPVAILFFRQANRKRLFKYILLANSLTGLLAGTGLLVHRRALTPTAKITLSPGENIKK